MHRLWWNNNGRFFVPHNFESFSAAGPTLSYLCTSKKESVNRSRGCVAMGRALGLVVGHTDTALHCSPVILFLAEQNWVY